MSTTPYRKVQIAVMPDWERFIQRLNDAQALAVHELTMQIKPFQMQMLPSPWAQAEARRLEQERRDAEALARNAQELSETTGTRWTGEDLLALARTFGDPVQGIRYGQHWTALVPPHARHLITDRSRR